MTIIALQRQFTSSASLPDCQGLIRLYQLQVLVENMSDTSYVIPAAHLLSGGCMLNADAHALAVHVLPTPAAAEHQLRCVHARKLLVADGADVPVIDCAPRYCAALFALLLGNRLPRAR
jgi:hypothetical protein